MLINKSLMNQYMKNIKAFTAKISVSHLCRNNENISDANVEAVIFNIVLAATFRNYDIIKAVIKTFIEKGGQIFQGNTTPIEELIDAKKNPEKYEHLVVRVGGYSARFVHLDDALQNEIINRLRHSG